VNDRSHADDPQSLGLLQLRADPQYRRVPVGRRAALVETALEDGGALADRTCTQWGHDPWAIAASCGVPVIRSEDEAGFGSVVVFADYAVRPRRITLYQPAILRLDRLIAQRGNPAYSDIDATLPIFLAHELYHHFDCTRGCATLSRQHRVRIFALGRWSWTSGLSSLAEIAAGAFAQRLLGLPFHPKALDLLFTHLTPALSPRERAELNYERRSGAVMRWLS
jgi:hypothetical protein